MSEIIPRVWLDKLPECKSHDAADHSNIAGIIAFGKKGAEHLSYCSASHRDTLHIPIDDSDDAPIFLFFSQSMHFIENCLKSHSEKCVLVCCDPNDTQGATVCIFYCDVG